MNENVCCSDPECQRIVSALNRLPGIQTQCSCCGHGNSSFKVWFYAKDISSLIEIGQIVDRINCWKCYVAPHASPLFLLESFNKGSEAYDEANEIADKLLSIIE